MNASEAHIMSVRVGVHFDPLKQVFELQRCLPPTSHSVEAIGLCSPSAITILPPACLRLPSDPGGAAALVESKHLGLRHSATLSATRVAALRARAYVVARRRIASRTAAQRRRCARKEFRDARADVGAVATAVQWQMALTPLAETHCTRPTSAPNA